MSQISEPAVVATASEDAVSSFQDKSIDKTPFTADNELTTSNIPALPEEKTDAQMPPVIESTAARQISATVQQDRNLGFDSTLGALNDTDRTEGLNEKSSRDSHPLDEPVAATAVENATLVDFAARRGLR